MDDVTATFAMGINDPAPNIALGSNAGANLTTGSNNIDIGNRGVAGDAAKIRIGKVSTQTATFIAGIHGVTVASGVDPDHIPQFGLVAEQVEKVNPDLVVRDASGKVNTVRYEAVNAMLLNEFLKEHRRVQEQAATTSKLEAIVARQNEMIAKQQKQIEALTATVQKVSDQIALSKPAPQLVANP
jgi:uncharacterized coiled-coil protein SlyX